MSSSRRQDVLTIAGLLLLAVLFPLLVSASAGTLEIARNDDWLYRRIAVDLARTGRLALGGMSSTMIVGQILFAQPFLWLSGLQPWAFTAAGVVFAVGGILSAYALARQLLPARRAVLAATLLALFPGYLAYATSFMSDVPALAAQFLCLALGARAVRYRPVHVGWLLASTTIGLFAFSIREFALAAPVGVTVAAIVADHGRSRTWAFAIAVAAGCVAIYLWKSTLAGQLPPLLFPHESFTQSTQALSTMAFVIAPAALVGAIRWRDHIRRIDLLIGLELGGILAAARLLQWVEDGSMPTVILSNLASQWGTPASGLLVGGRPLLFNTAVWTAVNSLALIATVVVLAIGAGMTGAHLRRCHRSVLVLVGRMGTPAGILVLFSLAVAGGLVAFALSRPVFDRYLWPLVPPLATLFLFVPKDLAEGTQKPSGHRVDLVLAGSATLFTAVLATVSVVFLFNSHAFDGARWEAGQQLVRAGLSPDQIDAGYEWVGYHATSNADPMATYSREPFYRAWWPSFAPCGVVSSEQLSQADAKLVGTTEYALNLVAGPTEKLYLYRLTSADCHPRP